MSDPAQQADENVMEDIIEAVDSTAEGIADTVENATEAVDAAAATIAAEEGTSEHKLEKAIAGIPDAISGLIGKEGDGGVDLSGHKIERAVAGIPDALTTLKEKELAKDAELRAAEGIVEEGEPEHKLEKIVAGIPNQITAIENEITEHVKPVIEQNSADAKAKSHEIAQGAIMTVAALVIAMFGIPVVLLGIAAALALVIPWWASLLIVGVGLLVIALICNSSAKSHFNKAGEIDVSLKAGIRKSFDYLFKGIGMPDEMAEQLRESK